jgi:cob(I)alamin adenosyltransferase
MALFLVVSAVFVTLYVTERSAHNRTQREQQSQLERVQQELDSVTSKFNAGQQNERYQQGRIATLEERSANLQKCADATGTFFAALDVDDETRDEKIDKAITAMFDAC